MTIQHHPDDATLMSFAAGSLPDNLAAVVAAHLAMCPRCRDVVSDMETLGRVLLDTLPADAPVAFPDRSALCGRAMREGAMDPDVRAADGATVRSAPGDGGLPYPISKFVGDRIEDIPWRRLGFGLWHVPLPMNGKSSGDLRLLKVAPGQVMPEHGHGGSELTLLLQGSYRDEVGTFRAGDVADLDDEIEHRPVADPVSGCICLIASEERARFKGVVARMVQPLTGI